MLAKFAEFADVMSAAFVWLHKVFQVLIVQNAC